MTPPTQNALNTLRRPPLLIRAARFGLSGYDRRRVLTRLFPDQNLASQANPLAPLIEHEAEYEARRTAGDASYSVARHVEILIALICEAHTARHSHTGA